MPDAGQNGTGLLLTKVTVAPAFTCSSDGIKPLAVILTVFGSVGAGGVATTVPSSCDTAGGGVLFAGAEEEKQPGPIKKMAMTAIPMICFFISCFRFKCTAIL